MPRGTVQQPAASVGSGNGNSTMEKPRYLSEEIDDDEEKQEQIVENIIAKPPASAPAATVAPFLPQYLRENNGQYRNELASHFVKDRAPFYSLLRILADVQYEYIVGGKKYSRTLTDVQQCIYEFIARVEGHIGSNQFKKDQLDDRMRPNAINGDSWQMELAWHHFYQAIYLRDAREQFSNDYIEQLNSSIHYGNILGHYFLAMIYFEIAEKNRQLEFYGKAIESLLHFLTAIPRSSEHKEMLRKKLHDTMHYQCGVKDFSLDAFITPAEDILLCFFAQRFNFEVVSFQNKSIDFKKNLAKWTKLPGVMRQLLQNANEFLATDPAKAVRLVRDVYLWSLSPRNLPNQPKWQLTDLFQNQKLWNEILKEVHRISGEKLIELNFHKNKEVSYMAVFSKLLLDDAPQVDFSVVLPLYHDDTDVVARFLRVNSTLFLGFNADKFYRMVEVLVYYDNSVEMYIDKLSTNGGLDRENRLWARNLVRAQLNITDPNQLRQQTLISQVENKNLFISQGFNIFSALTDIVNKTPLENKIIYFWSTFFQFVDKKEGVQPGSPGVLTRMEASRLNNVMVSQHPSIQPLTPVPRMPAP